MRYFGPTVTVNIVQLEEAVLLFFRPSVTLQRRLLTGRLVAQIQSFPVTFRAYLPAISGILLSRHHGKNTAPDCQFGVIAIPAMSRDLDLLN